MSQTNNNGFTVQYNPISRDIANKGKVSDRRSNSINLHIGKVTKPAIFDKHISMTPNHDAKTSASTKAGMLTKMTNR